MARLQWTQTQDIIELNVFNEELYNYFVEQLNNNSINRYTISDLMHKSMSQDLKKCVDRVQSFLKKKLNLDAFDNNLDASNQDCLNSLHREWVKLHQKYPNISVIIDSVFPGDMARINMLVHAIEESMIGFSARSLNSNFTMYNHFGTDILEFGTCNIAIQYNNLGRTTWHKWLHNDTTSDSDTNNFNELYTTLEFKVMPTVEIRNPPREYKEWCTRYAFPCVGNQVPLANFNDLEKNLSKYRQMFYKNSLIENNFIILE